MTSEYIVFENPWSQKRWNINDFRTAKILADKLKKPGSNPCIYKLIKDNKEVQKGENHDW